MNVAAPIDAANHIESKHIKSFSNQIAFSDADHSSPNPVKGLGLGSQQQSAFNWIELNGIELELNGMEFNWIELNKTELNAVNVIRCESRVVLIVFSFPQEMCARAGRLCSRCAACCGQIAKTMQSNTYAYCTVVCTRTCWSSDLIEHKDKRRKTKSTTCLLCHSIRLNAHAMAQFARLHVHERSAQLSRGGRGAHMSNAARCVAPKKERSAAKSSEEQRSAERRKREEVELRSDATRQVTSARIGIGYWGRQRRKILDIQTTATRWLILYS